MLTLGRYGLVIINDLLCEYRIGAIGRIDKEKFTDADLARLSQMKGEALFWRGWAHQQLVAFFWGGISLQRGWR